MKDFRRLVVWREAHQLALLVYRATRGFPTEERYGLTSQIRRAATSIPTNIAEGCGTRGNTEFARFVAMALASASELEYLLYLVEELGMGRTDEVRGLRTHAVKVKRMLAALLRKIQLDIDGRKADC